MFCTGASTAAMLVLNITAIVVAFIAFVAFLNSLCSFFGGLVGHPEITFEWLLGKTFFFAVFDRYLSRFKFLAAHQNLSMYVQL